MESQGIAGVPERFWRNLHVDPDTGCWLANKPNKKTGYGQMSLPPGKVVNRHRFILQIVSPTDDPTLEAEHKCRRRACCNPAHLEWVTKRENIRRGLKSALRVPKTHCPQGHAYEGENRAVNSRGSVECRTCRNARTRARYWANKKDTNCWKQ